MTDRRPLLRVVWTPPEARKVIHLLGWETTPGLMHCIGAMLERARQDGGSRMTDCGREPRP